MPDILDERIKLRVVQIVSEQSLKRSTRVLFRICDAWLLEQLLELDWIPFGRECDAEQV